MILSSLPQVTKKTTTNNRARILNEPFFKNIVKINMVNAPKRNALSDGNFEKLVLLKANSGLF
jgi:hypothetical protein